MKINVYKNIGESRISCSVSDAKQLAVIFRKELSYWDYRIRIYKSKNRDETNRVRQKIFDMEMQRDYIGGLIAALELGAKFPKLDSGFFV